MPWSSRCAIPASGTAACSGCAARSHDSRDFHANVLQIRYRDGHATWLDRNHFVEADWVPNNVK
ncbi:MAG: N-acetylmuramoyl-L-alanine amidase-like domain-containing protein, partial [Phycisphaerales bacterium]